MRVAPHRLVERSRRAAVRLTRKITAHAFCRITREDIDQAVGGALNGAPQCLFMHSSLSQCGYILGGEATVIEAVRRFCSTLCLPTHTYCYPTPSAPAPLF